MVTDFIHILTYIKPERSQMNLCRFMALESVPIHLQFIIVIIFWIGGFEVLIGRWISTQCARQGSGQRKLKTLLHSKTDTRVS